MTNVYRVVHMEHSHYVDSGITDEKGQYLAEQHCIHYVAIAGKHRAVHNEDENGPHGAL